MYKLIVTDMDGTFLNSLGEIPEENLDAVKRAINKGVEFAIVTGRPYVSVKKLLESSGLSCFVIGCNGAQVTDKKGSLVKAHYLNRDSLLEIISLVESEDIYYQLYDDNYIYTKSRIKLLKMLKHYSGKSIKGHVTVNRIIKGIKRLFFVEVRVKSDLMGFASEEGRNFYKIQIDSLNHEKLDSVRMNLISRIQDIDITSSNYFNLEIGPKNITKGTAVKELAALRGFKPEEIIAMGDNLNDIPMLEYAGCGVAMGNAEPEVKDRAGFITKENDEFGVAYAIDELIFKNKAL